MPIDPRTQAGPLTEEEAVREELVGESERARAAEVQGGVAKILIGAGLLFWGVWLGRRNGTRG